MCCLHLSKFNVPSLKFKVQRSTFNVQGSTFKERISTPGLTTKGIVKRREQYPRDAEREAPLSPPEGGREGGLSVKNEERRVKNEV